MHLGKCSFENLPPGQDPLELRISGRGLPVFCHFDIEENDYLTSDRKNPDLTWPEFEDDKRHLLNDIKVIEIEVLTTMKRYRR